MSFDAKTRHTYSVSHNLTAKKFVSSLLIGHSFRLSLLCSPNSEFPCVPVLFIWSSAFDLRPDRLVLAETLILSKSSPLKFVISTRLPCYLVIAFPLKVLKN